MASPKLPKTPRYLADRVTADLAERMVFVGGPRQVGKTTFALSLLENGSDESSPAYLNWDYLADRVRIPVNLSSESGGTLPLPTRQASSRCWLEVVSLVLPDDD